ncbi:MAG: peptidoglycan DD-metalloendopeptidase family protein [Candidatus Atribacteria bacterium]|nr:peptidoglycan DD-metalloendopeptidase family protein [Candidatus Atribacteria bacterium]
MCKKRLVLKNKKIFSTLILILTFILFSVFFSYGNSSGGYSQKIKEENQRLKKIEQQIKSIKDEIGNLQKKESGYLETLHKIEKLLRDTEKESQAIEKDLELAQKEIKQGEDKLILEKQILKEKTKLLENRLREIYKRRLTGYIEILFNSESFSDFLTRFRFIKNILSLDAEVINDIRQQMKKIENNKVNLENREEILSLLKREVEKEKENIEFSIKAKKSIINKIDSQKEVYLKSLKELEQSSKEIKNIIERIYKQQEEDSKRITQKEVPMITLKPKKGILALPVQGKLISGYGRHKNTDFNTYTFNSGIDISAPLGQVVHAAGSGEVIYTGSIKGYGQIIIIDHGGRITTLYAHLSKILIDIGDKVKKGQIVGQVGDSGGVSSTRLHFEVRVEGKPTDPMNWL